MSDGSVGRYRKKPVVVEATLVEREMWCPDWLKEAVRENVCVITIGPDRVFVQINTLEGVMRADEGDWIIRGVKGELYPCKPDIFEATYEPA